MTAWRYRYAWKSARDRAARHAAQINQVAAVADQLATRLHLSEVGRAEDLDRLIAAGRTIGELQAAVEIASRRVAELEAKASKGIPS